MKVEAVMTKDVRTVPPDAPLRDVARLLAEHAISGMPVVEGSRVVGVVSEADVLAKERGPMRRRGGLLRFVTDDTEKAKLKLEARTAGEAMSAPAVTIGQDRQVATAAARMLDESVNRLPVVDREGRLIGIVTRADLVRAFVRPDAELAREIREDILVRMLWIAPDSVDVVVDGGDVTLTGSVENRETAEMIPRFVQQVPGVVSVVSDVGWEDGEGVRRGGQPTPAGTGRPAS